MSRRRKRSTKTMGSAMARLRDLCDLWGVVEVDAGGTGVSCVGGVLFVLEGRASCAPRAVYLFSHMR